MESCPLVGARTCRPRPYVSLKLSSSATREGSAQTRAGPTLLANALLALVQALFREASSRDAGWEFKGHSRMKVTHEEHREQAMGSEPTPKHREWVEQVGGRLPRHGWNSQRRHRQSAGGETRENDRRGRTHPWEEHEITQIPPNGSGGTGKT